jgi:hypothetical protein
MCRKKFVSNLYGLESGSGPTRFEKSDPDKKRLGMNPDPI